MSQPLALLTTSAGNRLYLTPAEAVHAARVTVAANADPTFTARVEVVALHHHVNEYRWDRVLGVQVSYSHPAEASCSGWVHVFDPGSWGDGQMTRCSSCPDSLGSLRAAFGR